MTRRAALRHAGEGCTRGPEMSAAYLPSAYRGGASPRRRAIALGLALLVVALVIGMLLGLGVVPGLRRPEQTTMVATFQALPPAEKPSAPTKKPEKANKAASGAAPPTRVPPTTVIAPPPPPQVASAAPPKMLVLNHDTFAAGDIGSLPSHAGEGEGDKGSGKDSAAPYGPGQGPGGAPAYPVAWYREPTRAQMVTYEPRNMPPDGWAEVQCRMIERYHVENCREAGESPIGSGLARALRLASWQFLVQPPRRGGKTLIGSWVTIHYSWHMVSAKEPAGFGPGRPPPDDDAR